jgi:hypothetical protein
MKYTVIAFSVLTMVSAVSPQAAHARCYGCGVAAGVIGGAAAGAIIGSAIANSAPAPVYVAPPPPGYYESPAYEGGPVCHTIKRRIWVEGVGYRWSREEVCD